MKMAKVETAIRLVLAYYEAFNRHDIAAMLSLMDGDCALESSMPAPAGDIFHGKEEAARSWQRFFEERPGATMELEEVYGMGKRCVGRWTCSWLSAAGTTESLRGADIFRTSKDSILEILSYVKG